MLVMVVSTTLATQAQEVKSDSWPYWTVSKDVQRLRAKNVEYKPAEIRSGNADWAIAKGVHRVKQAPQTTPGGRQVAMTGYPTWTISKGVARHQAEKGTKK